MNTVKKEYQGVSPTQPDLWIDNKMDQLVKSKGGRIFAGLTALTVATTIAACTNAQPTNIPSETAPVPGGISTSTAEAKPGVTPLTEAEAQMALDNYQLPGPTNLTEQVSWNDIKLDIQKATLNEWVRYWISKGIVFDQSLETVMSDPLLFNSIYARLITGADETSVICMETTSSDLPWCYIPPIDLSTGEFYPTVPEVLPDDTFIGWQIKDREDELIATVVGGRPALMDGYGNIIKVLGVDSKFADYVAPEPVKVFTAEAITKIPHSEAEIITSCAEITSPIDNWEQYSKDMDGYLKVLHEEIFPNYTGPVLSLDNNDSTIMAVGSDNIIFTILWGKADIYPVACAKFKYNHGGKEYDTVMLTIVGEDKDGRFAINMVLNPISIDATKSTSFFSPKQILPILPATQAGGFNLAEGRVAVPPTIRFESEQFYVDYFSSPENNGLTEPFRNWMYKAEELGFDRGENNINEKKGMVVKYFQLKH